MTFGDIDEETEFTDCRRALAAMDDRGEIECEWLHPHIANWNCGPLAAVRDFEPSDSRAVFAGIRQ